MQKLRIIVLPMLLLALMLALLASAGCVEKLEKAGAELGVDMQLCPKVAGDVTARPYFCPEDECDDRLIGEIAAAKTYVHAAVYSFTLDSIGDALIAAHNRGVTVKVVLDEGQAKGEGSEYERLKGAGIDVKLDSNPDYMHNKFAIIDSDRVLTGSYNWTKHASEGNDENLIIISSATLAAAYDEEFWEIFNAGK